MTMEPGDPHDVYVHWAVHTPPARFADFERLIWSWVDATAAGITGGAETIDITPSQFTSGGYLLKGTSTALAMFYARGRVAEP